VKGTNRKYGSVKIIARLKTLSAEEGVQAIKGLRYLGYNIDLSLDRYKCFAERGLKCYACGLNGSYFALEYVRSKSYSGYALNLYGKKPSGKEEYFTKDHLIPKCLGGRDELSNYDTMCWTCNHTKGGRETWSHKPV